MSTQTLQNHENLLFIREITRQLCHPTKGLPKDLDPSPVTLGEWKQCLDCLYGWVNIGIQKNMAEMFHSLKIGEVIPSNSPNMAIYKSGFSTSEIGKLLNFNAKDKNYRAIINYYSFLRMINILMNTQNREYCINLNKSIKLIFTDLNPNTFWLNILVTSSTADYLRLNEIGEVIVKEGSSGESSTLETTVKNDEPAIWSMNESKEDKEDIEYEEASEDEEYEEDKEFEEDVEDEETDDVEDKLSQFSKMKVSEAMSETKSEEEPENILENTVEKPFRLVMNNTTLMRLLTYACQINGNIKNDVNIFQLMGGEDDEFTNLFGKLQI